MIRRCRDTEFELIHAIINDAAIAYQGVIPADCAKEPYMSKDELRQEITHGIEFWGFEHGAELAMLQLVAKFIIAHVQSHAVRLGDQSLLIDEMFGSLVGKNRQQHAGLGATFGKLLADHGPGFALYFEHSHGLVANRSQNAGRRRANAEAGADASGNQGYGHRGTNKDEQRAEDDLHGRPCILKLSNHSWITPSVENGACPVSGGSLHAGSENP